MKTLIWEDDAKRPLCILMHGDREVSAKNLARAIEPRRPSEALLAGSESRLAIGARSVQPCTPEVADRHSGYQVGGTSPFGLRRAMPVYAQRTIFELPAIFINGGARGFLVELATADVARVLGPTLVDVAIDG